MMTCRLLLFCMFCLGLYAGAGEWKFIPGREFPGAAGSLRELSGGVLQLTGDFSRGGEYVAAEGAAPEGGNCFQFEVKTDARRLHVRIRDSQGQTHRIALPLTGDVRDWQPVRCAAQDATNHWGGKQDGIFHPPARRIQVVLQKSALSGRKGTLLLRNFRPSPSPGEGGSVVFVPGEVAWKPLANTGCRTRLERQGKEMILHGDFSGGGTLAGAGMELRVPFRGCRVKIKTDARRLRLDLRDARDQVHRIERKLSGEASKWQLVELNREDAVPFLKPHDGTLHDPVELHFYLQKNAVSGPQGRIVFGELEILTDDSPRLVLPLPEKFFLDPDEHVPLQFRMAGKVPEYLDYLYCDYTGRIVSRGRGTCDSARNIFTVPRPGGEGFFELLLPGFDLTVGLFVNRPSSGKADPYFGLDFTSSWRLTTEEEIRSQMKILAAFGIRNCRDRLSWNELEPECGKFSFEARAGRYDRLRQIAREEGIEMLEVFHDTPAWNRRGPEKLSRNPFRNGNNQIYGENPYPENLFEAAAAWNTISRRWPAVKALEIWNEPDIKFSNYLPPDPLIAFIRAVSRDFRLSQNPCRIVGGVFAFLRTSGENVSLYRNWIKAGLLESIDVVSFHTYTQVAELEPLLRGMREAEGAAAGIPYWVSESGMPWRRQKVRAEAGDDRFSASEIVGKAVEFRALGVERYYPFKLGYGNETLNNFGMFDRNLTPMRSMAAYLQVSRLLAGRNYIGDLKVSGAVRSRVFSDGKRAVVCLYRPLDRKYPYRDDEPLPRRNLASPPPIILPVDLRNETFLGADGRRLTLREGKLPMEDGVCYLIADETKLTRFLNRDTTAAQLSRLAKRYRPAPRSSAPVIAQPVHDFTRLLFDTAGYLLPEGHEVALRLRLNNFSGSAVSIRPEWKLPRGVTVSNCPEKNVVIDVHAFQEFSFLLSAGKDFSGGYLELNDAGGQMMPLSLPLVPLPRVGLTAKKVPGNPVILSPEASFQISWTPRKITLTAEVADELHFCDYPAARAWNGDSLQFALQSRHFPDDIAGVRAYEFGVALTPEGVVTSLYQPKPLAGISRNITARIDRIESERKTRYRVEISPAALQQKEFHSDDLFGFTLVVNRHDGRKRLSSLSWGGGVNGDKQPQRFNLLKLK